MTSIHTHYELSARTTGFGVAAIVAVILNAVLTLTKESYPPLLAFMKAFSILGVKHHWFFHGLSIVILFGIFGYLFSRMSFAARGRRGVLIPSLAWATILSALTIFCFFLVEMIK